MRFVDPSSKLRGGESIEDIYKILSDIFSSEWNEKCDEVAECLVALRTDQLALRTLICNFAQAEARPTLRGAQSFLLHEGEKYVLRLNLWFPYSGLAENNERYRKYLSIDELHNHDFSFFTICMSGPGYVSDFYSDRNHSYDLTPGCELNLAGPNSISLEDEKVLFVEKDLDYHAQQWPIAFTTTLNCIPKGEEGKRVQYVVEKSTLRVLQTARA